MYRRYSGNDRRRFQRLDLNITILYRVDEPPAVRMQIGDKDVEATMLNLSEGGMGLVTEYNIPLWSFLSIKFTLSKMDKGGLVKFFGPLKIKGEVRSSVSMEKNEYRLGIRFMELDYQDKGAITDFVKSALRP